MKVLVVDDDLVLSDVVTFTLEREGFNVVRAFDGEAALQVWEVEQPDLIVLDVNLPKLDGFSVCQRIRRQSDTPILLLTVRSDEDDIIRGLNLGGDDYITKPFSPRQLIARAQAVLRRAGRTPVPAVRQAGDLQLDPSRREVRLAGGEPISLTPLESQLLDYLMLNAGHVLTTDAIIERVWGAEGGDRDALRQLVRRLRSKIAQAANLSGVDAAEAPFVETVPGLGYGLIVPTAD
ncbi:MAG: Alkaline phosphatase synthesis transcriptional regulatory protein PhoP [Anaerolineae bacterium]|nr:Alkaline phosphatase synthesis transcriptional regulatory protein PhoP [Anaerolineae bacterium]